MSQNLTALPSSPWLGLLRMAGPFLLAAAAGWGAVKFSEGQTQTRLTNVEDKAKAVAQQRESDIQRFVTQDQFKQLIDATRDDLREIKEDVRAIRADVQRR